MNKYVRSLLGDSSDDFELFLNQADGGILVVEAAQGSGKTLMVNNLHPDYKAHYVNTLPDLIQLTRNFPTQVDIIFIDVDRKPPSYIHDRKIIIQRGSKGAKVIDNNFKWVIFTHNANPFKKVGIHVLDGRSTALTQDEVTQLVGGDDSR